MGHTRGEPNAWGPQHVRGAKRNRVDRRSQIVLPPLFPGQLTLYDMIRFDRDTQELRYLVTVANVTGKLIGEREQEIEAQYAYFEAAMQRENSNRTMVEAGLGAGVQTQFRYVRDGVGGKRAVIFFGWVFFLISSGPPHVRCTLMGRTCGEPGGIELTPTGVELYGW